MVDAGRVDAAVAGRVTMVGEAVAEVAAVEVVAAEEEVVPAVQVAAAVVVAAAEDGEAGAVEVEVAGGGW